jgi:hypothetical protein
MSLLDDKFDITTADTLAHCFRYLMNPDHYDNPSEHSLWDCFWRISNQLQTLNILVETPEEIPSQFLIGWDYLYVNDFGRRIKIRLFDVNNIVIESDRIVYKENNQEYLYKFYKSSFHGVFGKYRLCQEHWFNQNMFPGFSIFQLDDIIDKFISHKKYIRLPLTDMEHYLAYQKKLRGETDYFQIIELNTELNVY